MRGTHLAGAALVSLAFVLAGCTTQIDMKQTEPFRIAVEGSGQTFTLDESDDPQTVEVDTCTETMTTCGDSNTERQIEVNVEVTQKSSEPCKVLVKVTDKSTGEELERRIVDVGGSGNGTTNQTGNNTGDSNTGQVVVQNIVVNIKGKDNLVVITEAQQGTAQVNIAARTSGTTQAGGDVNSGSTTTVTSTTTTTSSGNTTTSPP